MDDCVDVFVELLVNVCGCLCQCRLEYFVDILGEFSCRCQCGYVIGCLCRCMCGCLFDCLCHCLRGCCC